MYSLEQYATMFADKLRMDAYSAAIARAVRPGDAVVDLGCGPGIFALLACKAGARRVYAIDMDGVVEFGRHLAAVNGFSDRIHFLRGDSRSIHLPERVSVIVSDVRGVVPLHSHAIGTLEDARNRFFGGGRSINSDARLAFSRGHCAPGALRSTGSTLGRHSESGIILRPSAGFEHAAQGSFEAEARGFRAAPLARA